MAPYGDAGKVYVDWCAAMANSLDIGVPWIMCQQSDAPQPMVFLGFFCLIICECSKKKCKFQNIIIGLRTGVEKTHIELQKIFLIR